MMLLKGDEDQSAFIISQIRVISQVGRLLVTASTQNALYQGYLYPQHSRRTLDQLKKSLQDVICQEVAEDFNTLTLICEDVRLRLQNIDIAPIHRAKQQDHLLQAQINSLQELLQQKDKQRERKKLEIIELENDFRKKRNNSNMHNLIDSRQLIKSLSQKTFVDLLKRQKCKFPRLHTIDLSWSKITDYALKVLAQNGQKCPNLTTLDLSDNLITDQGFRTLAQNGHKFPDLDTIFLSNNHLTDEGVSVFAENSHQFPHLKTLYLSDNKITDWGLNRLALKADKFLNLKQIYLSTNGITDKGVNSFVINWKNFPKMEVIYLSENRITNQGMRNMVKNLKQMKSLKEVCLDKNKISQVEKKEGQFRIRCYIYEQK